MIITEELKEHEASCISMAFEELTFSRSDTFPHGGHSSQVTLDCRH